MGKTLLVPLWARFVSLGSEIVPFEFLPPRKLGKNPPPFEILLTFEFEL
jgi:hypothetical protein